MILLVPNLFVSGHVVDFEYFGEVDRTFSSRVSWVKASAAQLHDYQDLLSSNLAAVKPSIEALLCCDPMCLDDSHYADINAYAGNIIAACTNAADAAIPREKSRLASKRIPGWSEHVRPVRERSLFWHQLWIDCGRPKKGEIAHCMRRARAAYHYAIRKIKKTKKG
jgi:hypothetical protein